MISTLLKGDQIPALCPQVLSPFTYPRLCRKPKWWWTRMEPKQQRPPVSICPESFHTTAVSHLWPGFVFSCHPAGSVLPTLGVSGQTFPLPHQTQANRYFLLLLLFEPRPGSPVCECLSNELSRLRPRCRPLHGPDQPALRPNPTGLSLEASYASVGNASAHGHKLCSRLMYSGDALFVLNIAFF